MAENILICNAINNDHAGAVIVSPIIGRARLVVRVGHVLSPGQSIGTIWRLDQRFTLQLSDKCFGTVASLKSRDRIVPLAYGEAFMHLSHADACVSVDKINDEKNSSSNSVDAPMDGMFYLAPSPRDPPYVSVGDTISPGQTIGLIEVMKCFYPLKYNGAQSTKIVDILVRSASPVSLGTKLMIIQ